MKDIANTPPDSDDEIRASNAVLKLKLELEHRMHMHDTDELPPAIENQWLQNVYKFESQYKDAGRISVYDFVGRPAVTPYESLLQGELPLAITEMIDHLRAHGICLEFCCDYEDAVIYRFITTEFFVHEMDNIMLEGGAHFFTYEDFHPNHDYDLRRFSNNFINSVFSKKWNEFETFVLGDAVSFHEKPYSSAGISSIIAFFQDLHSTIELEQFTIQNVSIDTENKKAAVRGDLIYRATRCQKETEQIEGPVILHFEMGLFDWDIVQFEVPGL